MRGPSCLTKAQSRRFADTVLNLMSEEMLDNLGIDTNNRENAREALSSLVRMYINAVQDEEEQNNMLNNPRGFILDLMERFSVIKVSKDQIKNAEEQYDAVLDLLQENNQGVLASFSAREDDAAEQNKLQKVLEICEATSQVVQYEVNYYAGQDKKIESIQLMLRIPIETKMPTMQERAIERIEEIRNITYEYLGRTEDGRSRYRYNGKEIVTERASGLGTKEDTFFPALASFIGEKVDKIGRWVFDKKSPLYNKDTGELVSDDELGTLINMELDNIFTVSGLNNLIRDFQRLEEHMKEMWGNDIVFITDFDNFRMFAKKTGKVDEWVVGTPDMLVVDRNGQIKVIDFKSYRMTAISTEGSINYHTIDDLRLGNYSNEVSNYIGMFQSFGLNVDEQPYIVQIDTWYSDADWRNSKGEIQEGKRKIFEINENEPPTVAKTGMFLSTQIAKQQKEGIVTREQVFNSADNDDVVYWEPRLHIKDPLNPEMKNTQEAALREVPLDKSKQFDPQLEAIPDEERQTMKWLYNSPTHVDVGQEAVNLPANDIEGNPELIGSQELQFLSEQVMLGVSQFISQIARGEFVYDLEIANLPDTEDEHHRGGVFKGKDRLYIIKMVGLDNLIDAAFKIISSKYKKNFPTEEEFKNNTYDDLDFYFEDEEDYRKQELCSRKAEWIIRHKEQFIMMGASKLMSLENSIIPKKNTEVKDAPSTRYLAEALEAIQEGGEEEYLESFADDYSEGLTTVEAWMMGIRNYSPKSSLSQEVKRMFEDIMLLDKTGKKWKKDPYGWGMPIVVNSTMAVSTLMEICRTCETIEQMFTKIEEALRNPNNNWMQAVLDKLKSNDKLKKQFFQHFRKDSLIYSISAVKFDKKTGRRIIESRIINTKSALETMIQSLSSSFYVGEVGSYKMGDVFRALIKADEKGKNKVDSFVADAILEEVATWRSRLSAIYKEKPPINKEEYKRAEGRNRFYAEQILDRKFGKQGKEETITEGITRLLHGVGILVPEELVEDFVVEGTVRSKDSNNASKILTTIEKIIKSLIDQDAGIIKKDVGGIPSSLAGLAAFREYKPLLTKLSAHVRDNVEANVYQDGKTYYSYTNPSRVGHIIRNLKDSFNDEETFRRYMHDNYGRYTGWFKTVPKEGEEAEWLNDWLQQLDTDPKTREKLAWKVELSYIGNQYKELGELGFMLSILTNYFGSKSDQEDYPGTGWFALPTMSNKPTNEFIRMALYLDNAGKTDKDAIIDKVLLKTYQQEMNRIADVLGHYVKQDSAIDNMDITDSKLRSLGWEDSDIEAFKQRIENKEITIEDLKSLSSITSGAKFHFLWYLNDRIKKDNNLAEKIKDSINLLLTPKKEQGNLDASYLSETKKAVRAAIAEEMETVVEKELEAMERIGLFDTETRKVGEKEIEILKYQEQFNGKLGIIDHTNNGDKALENAKESMREALSDFIWQDIAANINIIQITGTDLAYYGNSVNYQKRIAQIHSPGLHLMHDSNIDDGYLRSVHISDEKMREEIAPMIESSLEEYFNAHYQDPNTEEAKEYRKMIKLILNMLPDTLVTDGQSYSSPTSMRKKLRAQGKWTDDMQEAYDAIISGDFNMNHLGVMLQPTKPFVTSDLAKYSGSSTMKIRRVPLQDKSSEYLIILAEALARGTGKKSKLVAICDFMELTAKDNDKTGIDTVHFHSVGKVGTSEDNERVIDIAYFDRNYDSIYEKAVEDGITAVKDGDRNIISKDAAYNRLLTIYLLDKVRRTPSSWNYQQEEDLVEQGILKREEVLYNSAFVDTIPIDDYIIQQEVPAHLLESSRQLYGSQIRMLGISDIDPKVDDFLVRGKDGKMEKMSASTLIDEYKRLHAENIKQTFEDLMEDLGLDELVKIEEDGTITYEKIFELEIGSAKRNRVLNKIAEVIQKELSKDARYGYDAKRACTLVKDKYGNALDFVVPLMDPIQSSRIQMLMNAIIKKRINRQRINGGPVVQTTAYDRELHIRFKDRDGNEIRETLEDFGGNVARFKAFLKSKGASIAYYECYMSIPNQALENLMIKDDGTMMSFEEARDKIPPHIWDSMMQAIGYRIPTEDKYSMVPIKIVGFLPKAAGQVIMMPQEITFLTGSDFDIDKLYVMLKAFNLHPVNSPKKTQKLKEVFGKDSGVDPEVLKLRPQVEQVISNGRKILDGDTSRKLTTLVKFEGLTKEEKEKLNKFIEWFRDYMFDTIFEEYTNIESKNKRAAKRARDNRILDLQWAVLTHRDTMSKILNPGNFDQIKRLEKRIQIIKNKIKNPSTQEVYTWDELSDMSAKELDSILGKVDLHNTTLTSSKIYYQHQNMQGSQMVGLFANHNISHAVCSFQKIAINLAKPDEADLSFMFDGRWIGRGPMLFDPQIGFDGQLVSKTIASFLAASVDTAKDPALAELNINTFTGDIAMSLIRMGFDLTSVGLFMAQPIIIKLANLYAKNSTDRYYDKETAVLDLASEINLAEEDLKNIAAIREGSNITKSALIENLNGDVTDDFQKRVLTMFYQLLGIAADVQKLTYNTKFNSVNNAGGPTIADSLEKEDRKQELDRCKIFHEPTSDEDYTSVKDVISNDPILDAFYKYTIGENGASDRFFRNFFVHYYNGFQNVRDYIKEHYFEGKKIPAKLYNQLVNDYIYYLLTYSDDNFLPTIPSSESERKKLIERTVKEFREVRNIKRSKPNPLLDSNLGSGNLRIRERDEYIPMDTLVFNSSHLDATGQQNIRNAWSDLVTMNDPALTEDENIKIRRFGVDLFFYTLMRNGFGFDPKTMMHLASVVVRYNATYLRTTYQSYISGLRNLEKVDNYLCGHYTSGIDQIHRFVNQFIRNHSSSTQLVPNLFHEDERVTINKNIVRIAVKRKDKHKLYRIMAAENSLYEFITITSKKDKKISRDLYQLSSTIVNEGDMVAVYYTKTEQLGLQNNFIEYSANEDLDHSLFKEVRDTAETEDDNIDPERDNPEDTDNTSSQKLVDFFNTFTRAMKEINIEQDKRKQIKENVKSAVLSTNDKSELLNAIRDFMANKSTEALDKVKEEAEKCKS